MPGSRFATVVLIHFDSRIQLAADDVRLGVGSTNAPFTPAFKGLQDLPATARVAGPSEHACKEPHRIGMLRDYRIGSFSERHGFVETSS
jgi:hypothetical protein